VSAAKPPEVCSQNTRSALVRLRDAGVLAPEPAEKLVAAAHLYHNLTQVLRLSLDGTFRPETAPDGLKALLAQAGSAPTFDILAADVRAHQEVVARLFVELIA